MIKKTLLIFFKLKQWNSYGLLCVLASEAPQKPSGTKKMFSRSFHQYSWNSEVETTWKSLICWQHRTSNGYVAQCWKGPPKLILDLAQSSIHYRIGHVMTPRQFKTFKKSIQAMKHHWKDQGLNPFPNWYIVSY